MGDYRLKYNINFDEDIKLGYSCVQAPNSQNGSVITFLYEVTDNDWKFHYANGTELTRSEKTNLEEWFKETYDRLEEVINHKDMEEYEFYQG